MNANLDATGRSQSAQEREVERALRPKGFDSFAGQQQVIDNLRIFVGAAKKRGEPLDHTLFFGPPGLENQLCLIQHDYEKTVRKY